MKILFYGAGIIGSYLIHILNNGENEITVVASEEKKNIIKEHGIEIYHRVQNLTTVDKTDAVDSADMEKEYDAVFTTLPFNIVSDVLKELALVKSPLVIMVGNNPLAYEMEDFIKKYTAHPKEVLFGFQLTGGRWENERLICERLGNGYMDIGGLRDYPSDEAQKKLLSMVSGSGFKLNFRGDMKEYLICHPAAILPVAYTFYICGKSFKNITKDYRKKMFEASGEVYELLKRSGVVIRPENDDKYYSKGIKGLFMKFVYFLMSKTSLGDRIFKEHFQNGVREMEKLTAFYEVMAEKRKDVIMNNWRSLLEELPPWEELS